jgi:dimethylhistidine N-methyltransferase
LNPSNIRFYDDYPAPSDMEQEVLEGLSNKPKTISPKYFYDNRGSILFERISRLPEYYATRAEISILKSRADEIADLVGPDCFLIELGSGNSTKVRLLLDTLRPATYMPIDISKDHLLENANELAKDYPWLDVRAACMDITQPINLPFDSNESKKLVFYPGSSIGNFEPRDAASILKVIANLLHPDGDLLIGVDIKKDPAILNAAYNDAKGVTEAFNKNVILRINRELDADFRVDNFEHKAFYNEEKGRIEMHLVSKSDQVIHINGYSSNIRKGEYIHTENSYKYSVDEFLDMARKAGLEHMKTWTDNDCLFSVHYFRSL